MSSRTGADVPMGKQDLSLEKVSNEKLYLGRNNKQRLMMHKINILVVLSWVSWLAWSTVAQICLLPQHFDFPPNGP